MLLACRGERPLGCLRTPVAENKIHLLAQILFPMGVSFIENSGQWQDCPSVSSLCWKGLLHLEVEGKDSP